MNQPKTVPEGGSDGEAIIAADAADACATAHAVRSGQMSAVEATERSIRALEVVNPTINGIVTKCFERAIEEARRVSPEAPLAGVPIVVKDYLATCAGVRHTESSRLLESYIADEDSEYVARLRRAGAVILATSNLPEFALVATTEPELNGATRNPWNLERSVGGSSGGSAALVSSRAIPAAHANDAGGSIRCPASCCGLFGLKPTRGRNSLGSQYGDVASGVWAEHVITRSVRDSAAFLDATAGAVVGDPSICPPHDRPFRDEAGREPRRLRIAVTVNPSPGIELDDACAEAVVDAAKLCEDLGHHVIEYQPNIEEESFTDAFVTLRRAETAQRLERWSKLVGRTLDLMHLEPLTMAVLEAGRAISSVALLDCMNALQRHARSLVIDLQPYDVWLTPTLSRPPVPLGWMTAPADSQLGPSDRDFAFCPYTWFANATGQPAMTVPLHWDSDGMPIGSQFVAQFGEDALLFQLAAQLERARPWANRQPQVRAPTI